MARINVEDSIFRDERFLQLYSKIGDMATAIGALVLAWDRAQRFSKSPSGLIPPDEWAKLKHGAALLESDLAETRDGGIYVRGSSKHCGFIKDVYEKRRAAGKLGGLKFKDNLKSKTEQTRAKQTLSPSPSPSPSVSPSVSPSKNKDKELKIPTSSDSPRFIGVYVEAYQKRYGEKARPTLGGKALGGVKRLLSDLGANRACELIQVFMQMDDPWFLTKAHDFETFAANLTKVGLALDTGKKRGGISKWEQEVMEAEGNETAGVPRTSGKTQERVWGPSIPGGENQDPLAHSIKPTSDLADRGSG